VQLSVGARPEGCFVLLYALAIASPIADRRRESDRSWDVLWYQSDCGSLRHGMASSITRPAGNESKRIRDGRRCQRVFNCSPISTSLESKVAGGGSRRSAEDGGAVQLRREHVDSTFIGCFSVRRY
jgi:hypothetical protein